jgi:ribosome assembly protein YihI (activator of Der GTPase)
MIRNCKVQLPDTERHHWSTKLDAARELMLEHGELTDALLDELKIGNNMNTIKDNYIIPRRRMIFLTNRRFIELEWEKLQKKLQKEQQLAAAKEKRSAAKTNQNNQTPERSRKKPRPLPTLSPSNHENILVEPFDQSEIRESAWV